LRIPTKDSEGRDNGWVLPLWSILDNPELRPDQVYVTAIAPHSRKGPHLHMRRRGLFACISGHVRVVLRVGGEYIRHDLWPGSGLLEVRPGTECALYNCGTGGAKLVNMPSPAWSKDDPDEHEVKDWVDPDWWNR